MGITFFSWKYLETEYDGKWVARCAADKQFRCWLRGGLWRHMLFVYIGDAVGGELNIYGLLRHFADVLAYFIL